MNTAKRQKLGTETGLPPSGNEGSMLIEICESDSDTGSDTASDTEQLPLKKR